MKRERWLAQMPALPARGEIHGVITVIQEDRFRVQDDRGRGYLFTLGRRAGLGLRDLERLCARGLPITVHYEGPPDLGGVAVRLGSTETHPRS